MFVLKCFIYSDSHCRDVSALETKKITYYFIVRPVIVFLVLPMSACCKYQGGDMGNRLK